MRRVAESGTKLYHWRVFLTDSLSSCTTCTCVYARGMPSNLEFLQEKGNWRYGERDYPDNWEPQATYFTHESIQSLLTKHTQLHRHQRLTILFHNIGLFHCVAQIVVLVPSGTKGYTFLSLGRRPLVRQQFPSLSFYQAQESSKASYPASSPAVDTVLVHVSHKGVTILHSKTVCVDKQFVDILFGAAVKPLLRVELGEWLLHLIFQGTYRVVIIAIASRTLGTRCLASRLGKFGAILLMLLPIRFLAISGAVVC